jgi:CHAT domain-containing protein
LATHGEFREDNPLFSGLEFLDGWLTTLDVFNTPLNASLVTLSACHTGRSLVGGGDELLGLMRAFLAAGADSLVMTHWAVDDHTTALLMRKFYEQLAAGQSKGTAIQMAQKALLRGLSDNISTDDSCFAHPFFWAPYFLVGQSGPL